MKNRKVLLIGYGNPGRRDDGLGPALAQAVGDRAIPGLDVDADYQLMVEDAAEVADHEDAIFADASVSGREPFEFRRIEPVHEIGFSSHSLEPEAVMGLAGDMFGATAEGYALAVRGYEFNEFGEGLSAGAEANLREAVNFIEGVIRKQLYADAAEAIG